MLDHTPLYSFDGWTARLVPISVGEFGRRDADVFRPPVFDSVSAFARLELREALQPDARLVIEFAWAEELPPPQVALLRHPQRCFIGLDTYLHVIDLKRCQMLATHDLACPFHDLVELQGSILCVHELGALRVDAEGKKLWAVDAGEVITGLVLSSVSLNITTENGVLSVELDTGTIRSFEPNGP